MANRIMLNTTSYHGAGAIDEIATEAKAHAFKKAFVCSDPDLIKFNVTSKVTVEFTDKIDTQFKCTCSKEKIVKALAGLSNKELDEIINDGKAIEVKCDFCNTTYKFSVEELKTLRKKY